MKKLIFSILFLLLLAFPGQAQLPEDRIPWTPMPLTWENFMGTPDPSSTYHANTSSGISYSWSMKQTGNEIEFLYDVQSYFNPQLSWVRQDKNSEHLLAHEQLHFNITELYARKLRKALKEFDVTGGRNIKPALQTIYKNAEASRASMQRLFDAESRHSMDAEAQLKWQVFIKDELKKLEDFSS